MTKHNTNDQPLVEEEIEMAEAVSEDGAAAEDDQTVDLEAEIETLRAERDSYLDQLQRSVAEFANYRRRGEAERSQLVPMVRKDVLAQFLPIIDDFERALAQVPDEEKSSGWMTGITMIESKLKGILERAGVNAIDPAGEPFDPSRHEAVATDPGSTGGTVVEVYQKGYTIGDMLVRPAMVRTGDVAARADA